MPDPWYVVLLYLKDIGMPGEDAVRIISALVTVPTLLHLSTNPAPTQPSQLTTA